MTVQLEPEVEGMIATLVESGDYESPEAVITAAVLALTANDADDDFAPGELSRLLAEGEASGPAVDAEIVFAEIEAARRSGAIK
jgi:putative addiction module CopG family antidote